MDLINVRSDATRRNDLLTIDEVLKQATDVAPHDETLAMMAALLKVPEHNLVHRQHYSRIRIEKTAFAGTYALNAWHVTPLEIETQNLNPDIWRFIGGLYRSRYVCRERGRYRLDGYWEWRVSVPFVAVGQINECQMAYTIGRRNLRNREFPLFDTMPSQPFHKFAGHRSPYLLTAIGPPAVVQQTWMDGDMISGSDIFDLEEGDEVLIYWRLNGAAVSVLLFDEFECRISINRTGDYLVSQDELECC